MQVEWNVKGQPFGQNARQLASFIGTKVKQTVPITISSWNDIDDPTLEGLKDELWCLIQVYNFRSV